LTNKQVRASELFQPLQRQMQPSSKHGCLHDKRLAEHAIIPRSICLVRSVGFVINAMNCM
jgi:hypothetical protein